MVRSISKIAKTIGFILGEGWKLIGAILLFLLAFELTAEAVIFFHQRGVHPIDWRAKADAYKNAPWVDDYYRKNLLAKQHWIPYVEWRQEPLNTQWIHVDEHGRRKTWNASVTDSKTIQIYMFGGSTTWGFGARDDYTIPSDVSRILAKESGLNVHVTNFGELGYVSTQEAIALLLELEKHHVPDVVLFYDGANDVYSSYQGHVSGSVWSGNNRQQEFNIFNMERRMDLYRGYVSSVVRNSAAYRILKRLRKINPQAGQEWQPPAKMADEIVDTYASNVAAVQDWGKSRGFKTLFYWQPLIFTKQHLTPYENQQAHSDETPPAMQALFARVNEKLEHSDTLTSNPHFHNISHLFDRTTDPLYLDYAHLSEDANERVARKMSQDILRLIRGRTQANGGIGTSCCHASPVPEKSTKP